MTLPKIVSREEWTAARKELLTAEKELTRTRDALNVRRRELPMVEVTEDYVFEGPDGRASLRELFGDHQQLIVGHFMFDPEWTDGCPSCTAGAEEISDGLQQHLAARDTRLVMVSRAPLAKISDYKSRKGWTFPWYSSHGSRFNYDYQATLDSGVRPVVYNFRTTDENKAAGTGYYVEGEPCEAPGTSVFLRTGDRVFHTYSHYARGAESTGGSYYYLDLTPLGRQEDWEEPKGRVEAARGANPDFAP